MQATGKIVAVNGNMITVAFDGAVAQNEVGYAVLGEKRLMAEIVRVRGTRCDMQVFESTTELMVDDRVEFTGDLLAAELGPGILTQVYDGLQNPLPELAREVADRETNEEDKKNKSFFLQRGMYLPGLPRERKWDWHPTAAPGARLTAGEELGWVTEGIFHHKIMLPFAFAGVWTVKDLAPAGDYTVVDDIATVQGPDGREKKVQMMQRWPVKVPLTCYVERLAPEKPLVTSVRTIDTFFPVAVGGTYCIPGPFGAGKTVLQQTTARYAKVDIVVSAACGERAGEVVEMLKEFPELDDPRTGKKLMDRTVIICNTSSMPVASREASVYTAVTLAEYYRQMGLNVLVLADSTSRWAQAMRELSGRLEEIPGEEAFPAYLESRIAAFYERAGRVKLKDGSVGSVTIGGTRLPRPQPRAFRRPPLSGHRPARQLEPLSVHHRPRPRGEGARPSPQGQRGGADDEGRGRRRHEPRGLHDLPEERVPRHGLPPAERLLRRGRLHARGAPAGDVRRRREGALHGVQIREERRHAQVLHVPAAGVHRLEQHQERRAGVHHCARRPPREDRRRRESEMKRRERRFPELTKRRERRFPELTKRQECRFL